jgi:hypothetical protein
MGGLSKWNILRDGSVSNFIPQIFGAVPEVVNGVLLLEAQDVYPERGAMPGRPRHESLLIDIRHMAPLKAAD